MYNEKIRKKLWKYTPLGVRYIKEKQRNVGTGRMFEQVVKTIQRSAVLINKF